MLHLIIFVLLQIKHFICDTQIQIFTYGIRTKGIYGQWVGVFHAITHLVGTFLCLFFFIDSNKASILALLDGIIHYHIDWLKVKLDERWRLKPESSRVFWFVILVDQALHQLTYLVIITLAI